MLENVGEMLEMMISSGRLQDEFVIYRLRPPGGQTVLLTFGDLKKLYEAFLSQSKG